MPKDYVEKREDAYWITGTRISLDSVVYAFRRGVSPESIQRSFPLLTLEQVYGAIAFYHARQREIDTYLRDGEEELERMRGMVRYADPEFHKKLDAARDKTPTEQS